MTAPLQDRILEIITRTDLTVGQVADKLKPDNVSRPRVVAAVKALCTEGRLDRLACGVLSVPKPLPQHTGVGKSNGDEGGPRSADVGETSADHPDLQLTDAYRDILTVVAAQPGLTLTQVSRKSSRSASAPISYMRRRGLVAHGQPLRVTELGLEALAKSEQPDAPTTPSVDTAVTTVDDPVNVSEPLHSCAPPATPSASHWCEESRLSEARSSFELPATLADPAVFRSVIRRWRAETGCTLVKDCHLATLTAMVYGLWPEGSP